MSFTKFVVYPYKLGSQSARDLAHKLGTKMVKEHGKYRYRPRHLVINWGNSRIPNWLTTQVHMLNPIPIVRTAADKILAFQRLSTCGMSNDLPKWTTSMGEAKAFFGAKPYGSNALQGVVCRTLTHANSGRGIVLAKAPDEVVQAPLYTLYKPKTMEFRVHVSKLLGVIDVQQKRMRQGAQEEDDYNKYIRSHRHGWVFCRDNLDVPQSVKDAATMSLHHLGLDFGAVDIGYHPTHGLTIYEVNTAPGLEGQTLINYVTMFEKIRNA